MSTASGIPRLKPWEEVKPVTLRQTYYALTGRGDAGDSESSAGTAD